MWNLFKRKHLVPVNECIDLIIDAMIREERNGTHKGALGDLWGWIESRGVKRKWSWREKTNYLVFDSEHDYTMFLIKL